MRTETINKLANARSIGNIIITYPEALFEKVVSPKVLEESKIEIEINESLDADTVIEVLVEYGFERVEFVYEPGQFSIRGGIVDIFSFGNDLPYRIELFDDEVESIRTFDPMNQLSVKNIAQVTIIPNIQTQFKQTQKVSLLNILPENTVVWIKNVQNTLDRLKICMDKAQEYGEKLNADELLKLTEVAQIIEERAFIHPKEIIQDMLGFPIIEIGKSSFFEQIKADERPNITTIKYDTIPQPSFNKNFKFRNV